ncbi:MAG: DUF86 domain-containing protein [Pseudomonadales bacterium]
MNYQAYTIALLEHVNIHQRQLDSLSDNNKPLSQLERSAAERSLQILVESAIGCAKHLNKKGELPERLDAYQAMQQVIEQYKITSAYLPQLKGAIGMRNAIVHDYLNLDWEIIQIVLNEQKYKRVVDFISELCGYLNLD